MMEDAGQKLKQARERLGLTYREVEEFSGRIAEVRGNEEFSIALSRLADIENKGTLPSLYRLYPLCAIYRANGLAQIIQMLEKGQLTKHSMKFTIEHLDSFSVPLSDEQKRYFRNFNAHAELNGL